MENKENVNEAVASEKKEEVCLGKKVLKGALWVAGIVGVGYLCKKSYQRGIVSGAAQTFIAERCNDNKIDEVTRRTGVNVRGIRRCGDQLIQDYADRGYGYLFKK